MPKKAYYSGVLLRNEGGRLLTFQTPQPLPLVESADKLFIIQLAGQKPSHILVPALHVSKEQVSALFAHKLGRTSTDIPEMTRIARDSLRQKFGGQAVQRGRLFTLAHQEHAPERVNNGKGDGVDKKPDGKTPLS